MTTDTVGGVWTYAMELAAALQPHGIEVALATMGAPVSDDQRRQASSLKNVELFESTFKLEWMEDPWRDVDEAGYWLLRLEELTQPDIVHLNGYVHGSLPWYSPVLMAGHSCVLSWWKAVKGTRAPQSWLRYRNAVRLGLQNADAVIAPSHAMLRALTKHYGPLPASGVIPNARNGRVFRPQKKEDIIVTAGRLWDEAKNVGAVAQVASQLPWPIFVAGDAVHPDGGKAAWSSVRLLGRLASAEIAEWFGRAAIFVSPARYEPFGLSVLEAALSGCALVLGDIASLRENWQDCAVFVPPEEPAALRDALQRLIQNRSEMQKLAEAARQRALAFKPETMARSYLDVYGQLLVPARSTPIPAEVKSCAS